MKNLALSVKQVLQEKTALPFSVYSSVKEQHIFNVPVIKPLLICVLDGCKKIGRENEIICPTGSFIFLSNSPRVDMRNIPDSTEYLALLIEFDFKDFDCLSSRKTGKETFFQGSIDPVLQQTLQQFVEWSRFAPSNMWSVRRQEILQLLCHLGYEQVNAIAESPGLSHKLHSLISADISNDLNAGVLSSRLAMSESTLRRKLTAEETSLRAIKDKAKLAHGLHLVQTTFEPIGRIAEQCGYQSQSRFTDKFKQLFGVTPTELRKTRMRD